MEQAASMEVFATLQGQSCVKELVTKVEREQLPW